MREHFLSLCFPTHSFMILSGFSSGGPNGPNDPNGPNGPNGPNSKVSSGLIAVLSGVLCKLSHFASLD